MSTAGGVLKLGSCLSNTYIGHEAARMSEKQLAVLGWVYNLNSKWDLHELFGKFGQRLACAVQGPFRSGQRAKPKPDSAPAVSEQKLRA